MPPLALALIVLGLGAFIIWATIHEEQKKKGWDREYLSHLADLAQRLGGEFHPHGLRKRDDWSEDARRRDVRFLKQFPFLEEWQDLDASRVENLIGVRYPDFDAYAFEVVTRIPNKPPLRRKVAAVRLTSRLPSLVIFPLDHPLASAPHSRDLPIVRTEWEEFNRIREIRSAQPREAHGFVTPEMMSFLAGPSILHLAAGGCYLYSTPCAARTRRTKRTQNSTPYEAARGLELFLESVRKIPSLISPYLLEPVE